MLGEEAAEQRTRTTLVTPKTTPKQPMYLPRCKAGTTSPMMAWDPTINPPAPIPWIARNLMKLGHELGQPGKHWSRRGKSRWPNW